jgi:dolichol-phosphate mannosyltransferase
MDADFSHDPKILPDMVKAITEDGKELIIGSRYIPGGGVKDWPFVRLFISKTAVALARPLTPVRDITSGYFMFRREVIDGVKLNPIGFKICLEVVIKGRYSKWKEVPYVFINRVAGKSKMGKSEVINYLIQLWDLWKYRQSRKAS